MMKLKPRERAVLEYIFEYQERWKNSPTVPEIVEKCKISPSGVRYSLAQLNQKGFIQWILVRRRWLIVPLFKE